MSYEFDRRRIEQLIMLSGLALFVVLAAVIPARMSPLDSDLVVWRCAFVSSRWRACLKGSDVET